jgi:hypothetical protein
MNSSSIRHAIALSPSRSEESPQLFVVLVAQSRANPHVPRNCPRDAGRKPLRRSMATRAILLKDLLPAVGLRRSGRGGLRPRWIRARRILTDCEQRKGREQEERRGSSAEISHRFLHRRARSANWASSALKRGLSARLSSPPIACRELLIGSITQTLAPLPDRKCHGDVCCL